MGHIIFHMLTAASRESFCRDLHLESCLPWTAAIRGKKKGTNNVAQGQGPVPHPALASFHHFIEAMLPSLAGTTLVQETGLGGNITQLHFLLPPPPKLREDPRFQVCHHLPKKPCGRAGTGCWEAEEEYCTVWMFSPIPPGAQSQAQAQESSPSSPPFHSGAFPWVSITCSSRTTAGWAVSPGL